MESHYLVDNAQNYIHDYRFEDDGYAENRITYPKRGHIGENLKFVEFILQGINMEKYFYKFQKYNISQDTFLNITNTDLLNLGIEDENDRHTIVNNLKNHRKRIDLKVNENHLEDLKIAKNVMNQIVLLQKYAAFLNYSMLKKKFKDYEGDKDYPPSVWLQIFAEAACDQCDNIINQLYKEDSSNHLIGKLLQMYNLKLPRHLTEKLKGNSKRQKMKQIVKTTILIGFWAKEYMDALKNYLVQALTATNCCCNNLM